MRNVIISVAMIAGLSLAMLPTYANAARVAPAGTVDVGGPDICVAACVNLPTLPIPPRHMRAVSSPKYQACGDQLAQLRRVTARQVGRVDESDVVHLVPLCDITNHSLTEAQNTYLSRGNVAGLTTAIAANDTLMAELEDGGYDVNDVLGVSLAPHAAVLYVSHR